MLFAQQLACLLSLDGAQCAELGWNWGEIFFFFTVWLLFLSIICFQDIVQPLLPVLHQIPLKMKHSGGFAESGFRSPFWFSCSRSMKGGCTETVLIIYLCAIALDKVYQNILSYLLGEAFIVSTS